MVRTLCLVVVALASLLVLVADIADSLKLPSYVSACSRSDPKFKECAKKSGDIAKTKFLKGDRKYHVPNMDPLHVDQLLVDDSKGPVGLVISLTDIDIYGFADLVLESVDADFEKKVMTFKSFLPRMEMICTHNISGKILILPVTGHGPANFTLSNFKITFVVNYELFTKPSGLEHIRLTDTKLDFTYDKAYLKFDNLFNGNKVLAEQMASFINENSALMVSELGPSVGGAISAAMVRGFSYMFDKVPYDDFFLP